jgi:hypothetical protein
MVLLVTGSAMQADARTSPGACSPLLPAKVAKNEFAVQALK